MAHSKNDIVTEQNDLNVKLSKMFAENGIGQFRLINVGNSIASGYSTTRTTKPLFLRNELLKDTLEDYGIDFDYHSFARPQNNCDEHFFEWFINNVRESDVDGLVRHDYLAKKTGLNPIGITEDEVDKYYPSESKKQDGLLELSTNSEEDMANIIVYNGCTGSFLDNNFRKGNFFRKFFHGIRKDMNSIEAIMQLIQTNNRMHNSNTQVFVCGVPNLMGAYISNAMNSRLKRLEKKYANVTYVPPIATALFYHPLDSDDPSFERPDLHYDEDEYLRFINNILGSISDNYTVNNAMIDLDRRLYELSQERELLDKDSSEDQQFVSAYLSNLLEEETKDMSDEEKQIFLKKAKKYLMLRFPYDFFYVGKDNIKEVISKSLSNTRLQH